MKRVLLTACAATALAAISLSPAMADGLSANGAITTNYVWRGASQTLDKPAVQGGLDYDLGNGLAVGTWASSIDFGDGPDGSPMELDLYGSYSGNFTDMLSYSVGVIGYIYPDPASPDLNFYEFNAGLGYDFGVASVNATVNYAPDIAGDTSFYTNLGLDVPVTDWLSLDGSFGFGDYDFYALTKQSYQDWSLGATGTWKSYSLSVTYTENATENKGKVMAAISFTTP